MAWDGFTALWTRVWCGWRAGWLESWLQHAVVHALFRAALRAACVARESGLGPAEMKQIRIWGDSGPGTMEKMPTASSLDGRSWRCELAPAAAGPESRSRCCLLGAVLVVGVGLVGLAWGGNFVGANKKILPPPAPPSPEPRDAPLFRIVAAPCNATVPAQLITTDEHTNPQTERMFVGGLPCLPDHCHTHDPSEVLMACVGPGKPGCCLSSGAWSERWGANLAVVAACSKSDPLQLWSKSGGSVTSSDGPQLCLDGPNLCLTHLPGEPVLVRGRSNPYGPGQDWKVTPHSVQYPGPLVSSTTAGTHEACVAKCDDDARCKAFHYDAASSSCELHGASVCLMAVPP